MKIKPMLTFGAACAGLAALGADVEVAADSGETMGVVRIARPTRDSGEIAVAAPFVQGETGEVTKVSQLLLQGFSTMDNLFRWNSDGQYYDGWYWTAKGRLQPMQIESGASPDPSSVPVPAGMALWFRGRVGSTNTLALSGLVRPGVTVTAEGGTQTSPAQTLFVNPFGTAVDLVKLFPADCGVARKDEIAIPGGGRYTFDQAKDGSEGWGTWGKAVKTKVGKIVIYEDVFSISNSLPVAAGSAIWYISRSGTPTVTWSGN